MKRPLLAALAFAAVTALGPTEAHAGDLQLALGLGGEASSWHGDGAGFGSVKIGYRFADIVAPYFLLRVGYANTDQRMLTLLSLGVQLWGRIGPVRPYLRFGLVHQHEETMASVANAPFGTLFGVGDGIRHRGGLDGALGADIPFAKHKTWQFHAMIEGILTGFPDDKGPVLYGGAAAGIGVNYAL
jgi:hypothetical protein